MNMFDYLQSEVWSVCLLLFTVVLRYFCLCAVVLLFTVVLWYGLFVYCCFEVPRNRISLGLHF